MSGTLTIRLSARALREIRTRAKALHTTPSVLVRDVLARELGVAAREATAFELTSDWVGSVRGAKTPPARDARVVLEDWRPDRRRD